MGRRFTDRKDAPKVRAKGPLKTVTPFGKALGDVGGSIFWEISVKNGLKGTFCGWYRNNNQRRIQVMSSMHDIKP